MSTFNDAPPFGPVVNGTMVIVFWEYRPSNVAGYLFLALFALTTLAHLVYFVWLRAWNFIPFLLGGVALLFGFQQRADAHTYPTILAPWILQNMLLLVAPPLLAASIYMSYGRMASALLHGTTPPNTNRDRDRGCCARCCFSLCCTCSATRLYVLVDIVAIFTQLIGTILPASGTPEAMRLSKTVVLIGLAAQLAALLTFLVLDCGRLHTRLHRNPSLSKAMLADPGVNWLGYLVVLEVSAVMLIVRSIVRAVEYVGGGEGVVAQREVFVYVFDAVPMLVVMVGLLVLYPARLVREVGRLEGRGTGRGEMVELRGGSLGGRG